MKQTALYRYIIFTAFSSFILIMAGGLVTSTGSGLSVPDWPLSYGQYFPPMIGGIRFEHTHRVIAGLVGFMTLGLTIFILRKETRVWMRRLGIIAFLAVVAQALLGGATVIYLLPRAVSVAHACLAQTFFSLVVSLAYFTSIEWKEKRVVESKNTRSLRNLLLVTTTFIYLQLIFGALVRHGDKKDPVINFHYFFAFLVFIHVIFILSRLLREKQIYDKFFTHGVILGGFVIAQVLLGFGALMFTRILESEYPTTAQVLFTTAHHSLGALILATSLLLTLRVFRLVVKGRV